MAEAATVERGNKPSGYKPVTADVSSEQRQVRQWRAKIRYAARQLEITGRAGKVDIADEYLEGKKVAKNDKLVYNSYLPSLLEEEHRQTLPRIPTPRVMAKAEAAEILEDKISEYLHMVFTSPESRVEETSREDMWDEDKWGISFAKGQWRIDSEYSSDITPGEDQVALDIERAQNENLEPASMIVAESDLDAVHISVHKEMAGQLPPEDPTYEMIARHIEEHRDRLAVIKKERFVLDRMGPGMFVYDADVPWYRRSWEAECKSVRIKELIQRRYKNVNPGNVYPEKRGDQPTQAWEDLTCKIWVIHDRRKDKELVIPVDGPEDGLFLKQDEWPYGGLDIYVPLTFRRYKPGQLHGIATTSLCIPILDQLARVDFYIQRHVEMHAGYKMGGPKSAGEPAIKSGLQNPDRQFVFEGAPESWAMMKEIKPPPIPSTLLQFRDMLLNELRRIIGTDAQNTGAEHSRVISATESAVRQASQEGIKEDRHEVMGEFLAVIAHLALGMFKKFATQGVMVRVVDKTGGHFDVLNPSDIPEDVDVFLDVSEEAAEAKAADAVTSKAVFDAISNAATAGLYPADMIKLVEWFARKNGVYRPEQFRDAQLAAGLSQMQNQGMPGVPGESGALQFPDVAGRQSPQAEGQPQQFNTLLPNTA